MPSRPKVGDEMEIVWLGAVRSYVKVSAVFLTHYQCDDGSRWFFYGRPYSENVADPWGVVCRPRKDKGKRQ